jgi:N-acetylglutamate synthase-like GNAT family acetyltransferase
MKVETRWARSEDYLELPCGPEGVTRRGLALECDGSLLALASITVNRNAAVHMASAAIRPELRKHPKVLHRFALRALETARTIGVRNLHAIADPSIPRSQAWLERLGFTVVGEIPAGKVYRCKLLDS